ARGVARCSSPARLHYHNLHSFPTRRSSDLKLRAMFVDHSGFIRDRLESFVGRQAELAEIRQRIAKQMVTGGYITITGQAGQGKRDRKSTRLNSSHVANSYAVFCSKKKTTTS